MPYGADPEVERFIQRAKVAPMLTRSEEMELGKHAAEGDVASQLRLVEANLRLVVSIARRYSRYVDPATGHRRQFGHLLELGHDGLRRAALRFDPAKDLKFSTIATWWIRQAITGGAGGGAGSAGDREPRLPGPPHDSSSAEARHL